MQTYTKQPIDQLDYDVDFSRWIPDGDTITSATAVLDVEDDLIVESVAISSPIVKVWLSGGTDKAAFVVTVTASTAGGRVKETEFKLRVKDT
jgi:hypothetical protein